MRNQQSLSWWSLVNNSSSSKIFLLDNRLELYVRWRIYGVSWFPDSMKLLDLNSNHIILLRCRLGYRCLLRSWISFLILDQFQYLDKKKDSWFNMSPEIVNEQTIYNRIFIVTYLMQHVNRLIRASLQTSNRL